MAKIVEFTIKADGSVKMEAHGFHGQGCTDLLKKFDVGGQITSEVLKDEFYEKNKDNNTVTTGN